MHLRAGDRHRRAAHSRQRDASPSRTTRKRFVRTFGKQSDAVDQLRTTVPRMPQTFGCSPPRSSARTISRIARIRTARAANAIGTIREDARRRLTATRTNSGNDVGDFVPCASRESRGQDPDRDCRIAGRDRTEITRRFAERTVDREVADERECVRAATPQAGELIAPIRSIDGEDALERLDA